MTNGLENAQSAVKAWRENHGDASLYNQCQRYDGWYTGWAASGFKKEPKAYASAKIAGDNATIFTTDVNGSEVRAGDKIYWHYGAYGHVASVIGFDGQGRTLVTHTSKSGDTLLNLGNHVKVSHADTIGLAVRGVSHTDGGNPRVEVDAWYPDGAPTSGGLLPTQRRANAVVNRREAPSTKSADLGNDLKPGDIGNFKGFVRGEDVGGNNIWLQGISGNWFWSGAFDNGTDTNGLPDLGVAHQYTANLSAGWAWYTSAQNAVDQKNPHGPKWTGEKLLVGTYQVVTLNGPGGAFEVRAKDGSTVWVSPEARNLIS